MFDTIWRLLRLPSPFTFFFVSFHCLDAGGKRPAQAQLYSFRDEPSEGAGREGDAQVRREVGEKRGQLGRNDSRTKDECFGTLQVLNALCGSKNA